MPTKPKTEQINKQEPFSDKWRAFGWNVIEVNGHNMNELTQALSVIFEAEHNNPNVLILKTIKGKGVSFMEDKASWHHGGIDEDTFVAAKNELGRLMS